MGLARVGPDELPKVINPDLHGPPLGLRLSDGDGLGFIINTNALHTEQKGKVHNSQELFGKGHHYSRTLVFGKGHSTVVYGKGHHYYTTS